MSRAQLGNLAGAGGIRVLMAFAAGLRVVERAEPVCPAAIGVVQLNELWSSERLLKTAAKLALEGKIPGMRKASW